MTYHLAIFALDTALVDTLAISADVRSEIGGWRESFHPADLRRLPDRSPFALVRLVATTPAARNRLTPAI